MSELEALIQKANEAMNDLVSAELYENLHGIASELASALKDHYKILYGNAPYDALSKPCPTAKALIKWEKFNV
jgi:hypothetical protein